MITEAEDYFAFGCGRCDRFRTPDCSARLWAPGISQLRNICLAANLTETAKWGHPCYMHANRNIAILGAFRDDFRLTFFNAALMKDSAGVLQKQGENSRHRDMLRFTKNEQVLQLAPVIASYLHEAMVYAESGIRAPRDRNEIELPEELVAALDADPQLAEAFHSLTPGRQRSYVINLNTTRNPATRFSRIAKFRDKMIAGKGANERL